MRRPTRLHGGLWVRMLVAGVVAVLGLGFALGAEITLLTLLILMFAFTLEAYFTAAVVLLAIGVGVFCCRVALATALRRVRSTQQGTAERSRSRPHTVANGRKLVPALVATGISFVVGRAIARGAVVDTLEAAAGIAILAVGVHLAWVSYVELTGDATAFRDLAESVRIPDSPSDDLEAHRRDVQARVDRLAAQTGVPAPAVRVGRSTAPIAATVGYRPETSRLVVSRGAIEALDDRELDAALAHELAHLRNRDATVVSALSLPAVYATALIRRHDGNPVVVLAAGPVAVVVRWSVAVVSRYREYLADAGAVAITGDPAALASALETLDRDLERRPATDLRESRTATVFSVVAPPWEERRNFDRIKRFLFRGVFGTHPPTAKRIERLRSAASTE